VVSSKLTEVAIIDYGMGNHASVAHSLRNIGFRVRVSQEPAKLNLVDVLILPGVGAFPAAMDALYERDLVTYIQEQARLGRPLIGICLGMQLFASTSLEHGNTVGLDLIPGNIVPFSDHDVHIGWNTLECIKKDSLLYQSDGQSLYFNHSFYYQGSPEFEIATARNPMVFSAAIQRGNIIGLQFHPEKSDKLGLKIIENFLNL